MHIAIIGAGYSGTITAIHLLQSSPTVKVTLIDAQGFGVGAAYSTPHPHHLLNVPADKMSAFADHPNHFVEWLTKHKNPDNSVPISQQFIARADYGQYLKSCLADIQCERLHLLQAQATGLTPHHSQWRIQFKNHPDVVVDKTVLALGNPKPFTRLKKQHSNIIQNPWDWQALKPISPQARILIIGTGLTMVDMVLSLQAQGHQGPITALSRHGLLPLGHEITTEPLTLNYPNDLKSLVRYLRSFTTQNPEIHWQSIVDGLRPVTQELWQQFSYQEKTRFLRHLRSYWDVHRHRIAPTIAQQLQALIAKKQLTIIAGRLKHIEEENTPLTVTYQLRHHDTSQKETWDYVIYCVGPNGNYKHMEDPLISSLRDKGHLKVDDLNGVAVNQHGALFNLEGLASDSLYSLGPPVKSTFWECIAVPDIRIQAKALSAQILG